MKKLFWILLIIVPFFVSAQNKNSQAPPPPPPNKELKTDSGREIFTWTEEMPSFPGGEAALKKFLREHMIFPTEAAQYGVQGTVFVNFVVEPDSTLSDISVLRGIGRGCDEEAIRLVKAMPKWIPGKQRGQTVRVQYNLPIKFEINEENRYNEK